MQVLTAGVRVRVRAGELDELVGRRRERAATGDLDLRALGVKLRGERVERDGLEADEVVAGGHARGDRRRPGRVLVDHLARAPVAVSNRARDQARLVDLEPGEVRSVHAGASGARALREVREHRPVRVRPDLVPVGGDGLASDGGRTELESAGRAIVVARKGWVSRVLDRVAREYELRRHSATWSKSYVLR